MEYLERINIVIEPTTFDFAIYANVDDCYIARELKKQGFTEPLVSAFGFTRPYGIDGPRYQPSLEFSAGHLVENFKKNISTKITLIKI